MAYTPINWAENLDVTAVKLDKMDNEIDSNESRITNVEDGTTSVAQADNADKLDGQHYSDIQSWVNNNADVPNADNARFLDGEDIEVVASGSFAGDGNTRFIQLLNSNFHKKYFWSVYSPSEEISQGTDAYITFGKQGENDKLVINNTASGYDYYYKAWALR